MFSAAYLIAACARPAGAAALDVPVFPDGGGQCGPAALAGVLRFWGGRADPRELRGEVYRGSLNGSLSVDLILAAQARGMTAEILEGGLPRVKKELAAGRPVIAFVNRGFRLLPIGHYLVLTGYDDRRGGFYANSGSRKDAFFGYETFSRQWERTGQWALLITPSAR